MIRQNENELSEKGCADRAVESVRTMSPSETCHSDDCAEQEPTRAPRHREISLAEREGIKRDMGQGAVPLLERELARGTTEIGS